MLISEEIKLFWHGSFRSYYEALGYTYTKKGDPFYVNSQELQLSSMAHVRYTCDECGKICSLKKSKYNEKKFDIDLCKPCSQLNKYRNIKYNDLRQKSLPWKDIIKIFISRNHILLSSPKEYKNINSKFYYICKKHSNKLRMTSLRSYIQNKNCCIDCQIENQSGENSNNWKGGISNIMIFLRNKLLDWKKNSIKNCNFKCVITGKKFNDLHHLHPFNKIIDEVFLSTDIPKKSKISDYSKNELFILEKVCNELHFKYPLGVCLTKELHEEFHSIYGKLNNTPEQFNQFKENYKCQHKKKA